MSSSFMDSFDQQQAGDSSVGSSAPFIDSYEPSPTPIYVSGGGFSADAAEFWQEDGAEPLESGPILPPPSEMLHEEGYALREWRRGNAIRLEEKEKREKELLAQILVEAEEYKTEFHKKRQISCETNRASNRDREKVVLAEQEKFHAEVDKNYWKSVADLIPKEVPTIAKKGKKEQEKKPSITVIQGPKPGKPTDLSRMRHILLKLKHNTPDHLKPSPAPLPTTKSDTASTSASPSASEPAAVIVSQKQVAVA